MRTAPNPAIFSRQQYPERTLLTALLLSAHHVIGGQGEKKEQERRLFANLADSIVTSLDPVTIVSRVGYGIPGWLTEFVLEDLTSRTSSLSLALSTHLSQLLLAILAPLFERGGPEVPPRHFLDFEEDRALRAASAKPSLKQLCQQLEYPRDGEDVIERDLRHRILCRDLPLVIGSKGFAVVGLRIKWCGGENDDPENPIITVSVPNEREILELWEGSTHRETANAISSGKPDQWSPARRDFVDALQNAAAAAVRLLRQLGIPKADLGLFGRGKVILYGVLPPCELTDQSGGLAIAMDVLGTYTDLPHPTRLMCTGAVTRDCKLTPLSVSDIGLKIDAMREDGLRREMLCWFDPDQDEMANVRRPAEATLDAAARAYWGQSWQDWADRQLSEDLSALGFEWGWGIAPLKDAVRLGPDPIRVHVPEVDDVVRALTERKEPILYQITGHARSGKTWIAWMASEHLSAEKKWHVNVLSCRAGVPISLEAVEEAVRVVCERSRSRSRNVLFIDNLLWTDQLEDLEESLKVAVERWGISIVAVTRQDRGTHWKWTSPSTTAITSEDSLLRFLSGAVEQFRPQLANQDDLATLLVSDSVAGRDLWLALSLLVAGAGESWEPGRVLERFVSLRLEGLSTADVAIMQQIAAYSLLQNPWVDTDKRLSDRIRELAAVRFGLRQVGDGWLIPSLLVCEKLICVGPRGNNYSSRVPIERAVVSHLFPQDIVLPESLPLILRGVGFYNEDVLNEIGRQRGSRIAEWCQSCQLPASVASVLISAGRYLHDDHLSIVVDALVETTIQRLKESMPTNPISGWEMEVCVSAIDRYQEIAFRSSTVIELHRAEGWDVAKWDLFTSYLVAALPDTVRAEPSPVRRVRLLGVVGRFHPGLFPAVRACLVDAVSLPKTAIEYRAALELLGLPLTVREVRDNIDTKFIQLMRNHKDPNSVDVETYCCHVALRYVLKLERRDFREIVQEIYTIATNDCQQFWLAKACRGFHTLFKADPVRTVQILNQVRRNSKMMKLLRRQCRQASPVGFATFVKTILGMHAALALDFMYLTTSPEVGVPDIGLVREMAARIKGARDAKGAGILLRDAGQIDLAFGDPNVGFATSLASQLGAKWFEEFLGTNEPRFSIVQHLIEGLIYCHAPFVDCFIETIVDRLVPVLRRSRRPAALLLALLLVEHSDRFPAAIDKLKALLKAPTVAELMRNTGDIISFSSAHKLAALYPEAIHGFGNENWSDINRIIRRLSGVTKPEINAQAFRAVQTTLRRAKGPELSKLAVARETRGWGAKIRRASSAGGLAQAINIISEIDPKECAAAIANSRATLGYWLRSTIDEPQLAVDLLWAVERGVPKLGKILYDELSPRIRQRFEDTIAHLQRPRPISYCFRHLAQIGVVAKAGTQERVMDRWLSTLNRMSSPSALVDLLRMVLSWDEAPARAFAARIEWDKVLRRLERGALGDLRPGVDLAGILFALGMEREADQIAHSIPLDQIGARQLNVGALAHISRTIAATSPALARELSLQTGSRIASRIAQSCPLDDLHFWEQVGWLAYFSHSLGEPIAIESEPSSWSFWRPPALNLWVLAWLAPNDWAREEIDRAREEMANTSNDVQFDSALAACALGRLGYSLGSTSASLNLDHTDPAIIAALLQTTSLSDAIKSGRTTISLCDVKWRDDPWRRRILSSYPMLEGSSILKNASAPASPI